MKHFIKLIWVNYRYCFIRSLEFRAEVISWSLNSAMWLILTFIIVSIMFTQVDSIAGWTKNESLILTLSCSIFNSFLWLFAYPSILRLEETIRTGYFDFYLLKPVNSQFLSGISRFEFDNYFRVIVGLAMIAWLINKESIPISIFSIINYLTLFLLGIIIFYSLFFIIATLTFWLIESRDTESLLDSIITSGRYPSYIFKGALRIIFFYIIPLAFVGTFPVQALLGKGGINLIIQGFVLATIFLIISHSFWNFALKHYSSASS